MKKTNTFARSRSATVLLQTKSQSTNETRALEYLRQAADGGCAFTVPRIDTLPILRRVNAAIRVFAFAGDAGVEIKELTGKGGVEIAFETSGAYPALEDAMRSVCYGGTVVSTAYYHGERGVMLAGEWHRNRINVISSRANSQPLPQPNWTFDRIREESLALLVDGRLDANDLIDPIVPFARAADAYHEINEHPERSIKLGIDHRLPA